MSTDSTPLTDLERADANIAACYEKLKAFESIAPPVLMRELREAVERHTQQVRSVCNMLHCIEIKQVGEEKKPGFK